MPDPAHPTTVRPHLPRHLPPPGDYLHLSQQVAEKHVDPLALTADGTITGTYRSDFHSGDDFTSHYPTGLQGVDTTFLDQVRARAVVPHFRATVTSGGWLSVLLSFLPFLLLVGYFV